MSDADTRNGVFSNAGWGGGLFNGNVAFGSAESCRGISGLGVLADPVAAGDDPSFPWAEFSTNTQILQQSINELLIPNFCKLTVDGRLGPRTCGALDKVHPSPLADVKTCENRRSEVAFIAPSRPPCAAEALPPFLPPPSTIPLDPVPVQPPPVVVAPPPPAEEEEEVDAPPVKEGNNTAVLILGAAALFGIAAVALASRKKNRK